MSQGRITLRAIAEGRVQGVGYREFTRRAALAAGVSGWVRNRFDGTVEALLHGEAGAIEALLAEMRRGPDFASVTALEVITESEPNDSQAGAFVVGRTV
jgi:acylphosphatase